MNMDHLKMKISLAGKVENGEITQEKMDEIMDTLFDTKYKEKKMPEKVKLMLQGKYELKEVSTNAKTKK